MSFLGDAKPHTPPGTQPSHTTRPFNGRRHPKNYDGSKKTTWFASELAAMIVKKVTHAAEERPDLILAAWADMMGKERADRIQAERFEKGILHVRVSNSLLFSLLRAREKEQYLNELRRRFPKTRIDQIVYRMG